jgi:hypothetical protein
MYMQIKFKEVLFDVECLIEESEPMVRNYGDGSGYPGSVGGVTEVSEFSHNGTCFINFYDDYKDEINELILETLND